MAKSTIAKPYRKKIILYESFITVLIVLLFILFAANTNIIDQSFSALKQYPAWHDGYILAAFILIVTSYIFSLRRLAYYRRRSEEHTARLIETNQQLEKEIKEHKKAQYDLHQSEQRYRSLVEMLPDAVAVHRFDGKILFINEAGIKLTGADKRSDLIGESIYNFLHPDFHKVVSERIIRIQNEDYTLPTVEEKIIRMDGTFADVEIAGIPLPYEKDGAILAVVHDISERKHMEEALRSTRQRYRDLIEFLPDAVLIHTADRIIFANQAAAQLLGMNSSSELIGMDIMRFIPPGYRDISRNTIMNIVTEQMKVSHIETEGVRSNGDIIDLELSAIPYLYDDISAVLVVLHDITERKQTERLNKVLNETLEQDMLKTEFFSNISHELKTPLNVILGTVQLLGLYLQDQDNLMEIDTLKYIAIMRQNCYRLLRLVNNLIDISRIDSGFYSVELRNNNIVSVVEEVCMSVAEYINSKNLYFEFDTEVEEIMIACDPDKLERVILNLLSNAIKFTSSGGSIRVNIQERKNMVQISVLDTGVGIPENKMNAIFERFHQVDKSLSRNYEGSGIGLSLVASIIKMHGGSIEVKSIEGQGSEFIMMLPVYEVNEPEEIKLNHNMHRSPVERIQIEFSDIYS